MRLRLLLHLCLYTYRNVSQQNALIQLCGVYVGLQFFFYLFVIIRRSYIISFTRQKYIITLAIPAETVPWNPTGRWFRSVRDYTLVDDRSAYDSDILRPSREKNQHGPVGIDIIT